MALFFYTKAETDEKQIEFLVEHLLAGANITLTKNTTTGHVTISSIGGGGEGVAGVTTFNGRNGIVTGVKGDYSGFFVDLEGAYANPDWLTSIPWSKVTNRDTTLAGYGITDALTASGANILTGKTINGADNVIIIAVSSVTGLQAALDGKQDIITNLPANKGGTGIIAYTTGNYINAASSSTLQQRTPAQVKADLGLDQVSNTSDSAKNTATATLTGKTLAGNVNTFSLIPQSAIVGLAADLALKLSASAIGLQPQITLTYSAGASTWNMALGVNAIITISGNAVITITASSFLTTYSPTVRIVQTGTKGYTVTFVYSGAIIYYSGGAGGNVLSTATGYRAVANLRLVNSEIEVSIDPTFTTTP